jgi:hypothetical protein
MATPDARNSFRHPSPRLREGGTFGLELPDIPKEIFISYARSEEAAAVEAANLLENYGFTVFRDRTELDSGAHYPSRLEKAIADSRAVVALLSPHSVTRDWVKRECALALEQGKLVACTLGPLDPGLLPEGMRELHLTDLTGRTGILPATIELLRTLARLLKRPEIEAIVMDAQRRRKLSEPRPLDAQGIQDLNAEWRALKQKPVLSEILTFFQDKVKGSPIEEEFRNWMIGYGRFCGDEAWKWYLGREGRKPDAKRAMDLAVVGIGFEDERAQTVMGMILRDGSVVPANLEWARESFERAALMSDITGAKYLAWMLRNGEGGEEDVRAAAGWFRRAAAGGDAGCMTEYAILCIKGLTDESDMRVVRYWFTKAALAGEVTAKLNLAQLMFAGSGGEQDTDRALTLAVEGAEELLAKPAAVRTLQDTANTALALSVVKTCLEAGAGSEYVRSRAQALIEPKDRDGATRTRGTRRKSKRSGST